MNKLEVKDGRKIVSLQIWEETFTRGRNTLFLPSFSLPNQTKENVIMKRNNFP